MEKVKNIFGAFFDVNSFSIKKIIIAILFLFGFYVLKGLFSTLIIKIFKVKGKENIVRHNGVTADVNSLYPSMMHSQSGNYFPMYQLIPLLYIKYCYYK